MSDKEISHLRDLLTTFDAESLGEGDLVAGANTLAAMACSLANIARPGSGIRTPEGRLHPVGSNLLVTGSLSSSLVQDEIIVPLGQSQNHLLTHLLQVLKDGEAEARKDPLHRKWELPKGAEASSAGDTILQLFQPHPSLMSAIEEAWADVVRLPPSMRLDDLALGSRVFIATASLGQLKKLLPGAHLGHALVHLGITRASDFAGFGEFCSSLMDGRVPAGEAGQSVTGRLLITDAGGRLGEAATADDDRIAWLGRLTWLADGNSGPEPPEGRAENNVVRPNDITVRFQRALHLAWGKRLNNHELKPVIKDLDFSRHQSRWVAFLKGMEGNLPGISGTARRFLASLVFGFTELVNAGRTPKGFKYSVQGIEAFARFLIRRMANARASILWSAQDAWRRRTKSQLVRKLADCPQLTARELRRKFHSLPAPVCLELLGELAAEGWVGEEEKRWRLLRDPAELPTLCLEA